MSLRAETVEKVVDTVIDRIKEDSFEIFLVQGSVNMQYLFCNTLRDLRRSRK